MDCVKIIENISDKLKNSNVKIISFDVFNTILKRTIPSEDVVKISALRFSELIEKQFLQKITWKKIYDSRIKYSRDIEVSEQQDWTILEWLSHLKSSLNIEYEISKFGTDAELFAETLCTESIKGISSFIENLRIQGYTVIAISDTWLDHDTLYRLLRAFDFNFDHIFSSGSIKASKKRGDIFKYIQKELKISERQILHIGDNLESDFLRPKFNGWKSFWLPRKHPLTGLWIPKLFQKGFLKIKKSSIIYQLLIKKNMNSEPLYKMAYQNLAPLVALFSFIQNKKFNEQNIKAVFFIARDAHILYKAYNLMANYLKTDWEIFYIRLSRRAVAACHPKNPLINVKPIAGKTGRKSVNNWLGSFAIDQDLKLKILEKANLNGSEPFSSENRIKLEKSCNFYIKELELFVKESKNLLADFIKQHFSDRIMPEKIGIIDSGWACTLQDSIANILSDLTKINGLYFGVSYQGVKHHANSAKFGLLRDDFRNKKFQNPFHSSAGVIRVWDIIFREDAPTVASLRRSENGIIIPVMKEDKSLGSNEKKACMLISNGVMDGIYDRKNTLILLSYLIDIWDIEELEVAANKFADKIAIYPDKETAREILKLGLDEGIGSVSFKNLGISGKDKGMMWVPGIISISGVPTLILDLLSPILSKIKNLTCK
ncbi:MAG: HAD-IA family hydrolase [Desulfamplus sp.]|nr:HAD-IA family hydrolase [Desulfamplus sp.]